MRYCVWQGEGGAPKQQGHGVSDQGHHMMHEGHGTLNSRKSSDLDGSTLKEQLANKVRGSSSIPGSFYERDIEFKSKAYEDRKAAVSPRNQGLCQYVMHCVCQIVVNEPGLVSNTVCVCVCAG